MLTQAEMRVVFVLGEVISQGNWCLNWLTAGKIPKFFMDMV